MTIAAKVILAHFMAYIHVDIKFFVANDWKGN